MTSHTPPDRDPITPSAPDTESESLPDLTPDEVSKAQELREFLIAVGHFMDLPSKRPTRATMAVPAIEPKRVRIMRRAPLAAVALLACVLALTLWNRRRPTLPDALVGDWVTSNPRYADRLLAFTPTEVILGLQQGPPSHYRITRLETRERADSVFLALVYDQDGEPTELHATLINGSPARLLFAQPAGLMWVRRPVTAAR